MKNRIFFLLSIFLTLPVLLTACVKSNEPVSYSKGDTGVTVSISHMYAGDDMYSRLFEEVKEKWEKETGNQIAATASTADEAYKNRIIMEFQTGAEPDVLFYFNGTDSNTLVANKRVVSIDEIRREFPEYAANMKEGMMKASSYDGKIYCVPVNGYWEALYVNKNVLEKVGIEIPDKNTTWDEFMDICENIKNAGYVPIAASLCEVPHYWFEYCIYNYQSPDNHEVVPEFVIDNMGQAWVNGITEIKNMYEKGFFPEDTLYISDEGAKKLFLDSKAAFLLEGSWYASAIDERTDSDNFAVTYVPGTDIRKTTDIISGLSTGYYITKKAWDDPLKREAAVSLVEYLTTTEMVSKFAAISATALADESDDNGDDDSEFILSAKSMVAGATGYSEAVQDYLPANCRMPIFDNMKKLMTGETDITEAVKEVISLKKARDN